LVKLSAAVETGECPANFDPLVVPLLAEHGEKHDHAVGPVPVRDPPCLATHVEAKLEEAVSQRAAVRHPEQMPVLFEHFDVSGDDVLVVVVEGEVSTGDLRLQFHLHAFHVITLGR